MKATDKKNTPGWANFKKWYDHNKQTQIKNYFQNIMSMINENLDAKKLFQHSEEYETISYKKIFKGLNTSSELHIPEVISGYFYLQQLILPYFSSHEYLYNKEKIGNLFSAETIETHDSKMISFSKKVHDIKDSFIKDAAVQCSFMHDLNIWGQELDNWDIDSVKISLSQVGRSVLKEFKNLSDTNIDDLITSTERIIDDSVINMPKYFPLLIHMIPMILFIQANLPVNEYYTARTTNNSLNKAIKYILMAASDLYDLDAGEETTKLKNVRILFLLKAMDSIGETRFERALTTKTSSDKKYTKKYNSVEIAAGPVMGNDDLNEHYPGGISIDNEYGVYTDIEWLIRQMSKIGFNQECDEIFSPFRLISIFEKMVREIAVNLEGRSSTPFKFNKTANLFVFNKLTALYDAYFLKKTPELFRINWMDSLIFKKALINIMPQIQTSDIDILNLLFWSLKALITKDLENVKTFLNFDPYNEYIEELHRDKVEPKPKLTYQENTEMSDGGCQI